ncbi:glycoside hydrolase family protein [Flagellimonas sp. HMM57]|uniref:glycoside hydrolase family protein n=1 Tax=unclassified Flagellimonas TaxID=2644544 RepID=UPI0013D8AD26|nr:MULTISPECIES: glycoside hydrolase family protein [unclassified Flagellimonas]UII75357.1 glycoside hydrolase family protein [Flagellimonas sp. HMM57]
MPKGKYTSIFILSILIGYHSCISQSNLDFTELLPEKLDKANIISEEGYNVWGTNILKGKDGKYHAIYSRWPKSRGHHGWATHSEIAHAISDSLTGPYKFQNLVLPPRGKEYWDGDCTHNPHVVVYEGRYYLYYMGNHGSGYWGTTPGMPSMKDDQWWVNRNHQRIGVAVTDDLNDEWERFDKPLIDIDATRRLVSTPVVSIRPDGKFLMVYKYVKEKEGMYGGKVVHVTALSNAPLGPFKDTGKPFIEAKTSKFALDDHVEWFQDGHYYCIGKDHDGSLTSYSKGTMVLYTSDEEGLDWSLAEQPLVLKAGKLFWTDNSETLCERTADMPKLYFEGGIPKALIIAVLPKDSEDSFSVVMPFKTYGDE